MVSIHAPVKGATERRRDGRLYQRVSIHAPVKGATVLDDGVAAHVGVSIHAPVKGATPRPGCPGSGRRRFNPRAREGRDGEQRLPDGLLRVSIHAPVKGATAPAYGAVVRLALVSIHAPVKGATRTDALLPVFDEVSIHAPVKGATLSRPPFDGD